MRKKGICRFSLVGMCKGLFLSIQNNLMRVICLKSLVCLDVLELLCLFVSCLPDGD